MGMAPLIMSPLAAWLVSNHDLRTSMLVVSAVVAAVMIPVALLVRRPPAACERQRRPPADGAHHAEMSIAQRCARRNSHSARDNFLCCATIRPDHHKP